MARSHKDITSDIIEVKQVYKHHKVGDFTCEAETEFEGKIVCCLHNPITGEWKWPEKGKSE